MQHSPRLSVQIIASFTADPVEIPLEHLLAEMGIPHEITFAPYNHVFQELLDPSSRCNSTPCAANLLLVRLEDWADTAASPSSAFEELLRKTTLEFVSALDAAAGRKPSSSWIVTLCPPSLDITQDTARSSAIHRVESELTQSVSALNGPVVLHHDDIAALYPVDTPLDPKADELGRVPYTPVFFAALATALARRIMSLTQAPRKVIVLDCDNTLWQGVCGESQPSELAIDGPWRSLQQFMAAQQSAGRLLCLCSKNAESDVTKVFEGRPDMPLKREHIVAQRINWNAKSDNIRSLADELQLGLDSFIFVDDNPVECAEVEARCPGVAAIQLPADASDIPEFLKHVWLFDQLVVTTEDSQRSALYRANSERELFRTAQFSFHDFIEGLNLKIDVSEMEWMDIPRVSQLTQRTNQFNATTRRRSEAELQSLFLDANTTCLVVNVHDKFGDYGLVGAAIYQIAGDQLEIDTFLLSCRVLGKGVEHALLAQVAGRARSAACRSVSIPCFPTERNEPVQNFLKRIGSDHLTSHEDGFLLTLAVDEAVAIRFDPDSDEAPTPVSSPRAAPSPDHANTARTFSIPLSGPIARIAGDWRHPQRLHEAVHAAHRKERSTSSPGFVPLSTPEEKSLAKIWSEVLAVEQIGAQDHFFKLGGNSLAATRVLSRVFDVFQTSLPLTAIFDTPILGDLAQQLASGEKQAPSLPPVSPVVSQGQARRIPSPSQQRMWFLDHFMPGLSAYNIPACVHLRGPLEVDALEESFRRIIARHEVLRSTFPDENGQAVVQVTPGIDFTLAHADLSPMPAEERRGQAHEIADEEARQPFDLSNGPLLRARLIRLDDEDHFLSITIHHIISDGWSMSRFFDELVEFYRALTSGNDDARLPDLPVQFSDFALWQIDRLEESAWDAQLAFWKQTLQDAPQVLDLPTDHPRPPALTYRGATRRTRLSAELAHQLETLSREHDATLFMLLLAAFQTLLHRYTGQEDILVGSPVAARPRPEVEPLIGCFINTLVFRGDLSDDPTFTALLERVRRSALSGYANQDLPFDRLVDELNLARDLSHSPLFQVMFVLQNTPGGDLKLSGLETEPVPVHNSGSKFDLVLEMTDTGNGIETVLEYNRDLFEPATIDRMLDHLTVLLNGIQHDADRPISQLPILGEKERNLLLHAWNPPPAPPAENRTLHQWFEDQVRSTPEALAVTCNDESLSYRQLNEQANQLAHFLRNQHGVGPDVMVGICTDRSLDTVVAILAILKAGGAYVPIDLAYPAQRLAFILDDCQAPVLLTQSKLVPELPTTNATIIAIDSLETEINASSPANPDHINKPADLAYVIYTSGSTGKPKGALIKHENVTRLFEQTQPWFHFDDTDVWTLFHSYAFDFSVWEIWGALVYGGRLVVVPHLVSRSPEDFYALLGREKVTVLNQTPSAFRQLIQAEGSLPEPLPLSLRYVIFGGEALEMQSLKPWFDRHGDRAPQLVNMYGITETTVHVTYRPLSADDLDRGSVIGVPIPDLQVYILDHNLNPVPIGVPGEMFVGGHGLARGYLNRDELTAKRFIQHPFSTAPGERLYRTGDLARFLPDHDIEYLGRIDHQVKIRGFRMELGEIESVLCQHPRIQECAVVVREDNPGHKSLTAYLITSGNPPTVDSLRQFLNIQLPDYMVPASFLFLERFPLTNNGKLDTRALPAPAPERRELAGNCVAPRTPQEETLAAIWSEVLRLDQVGTQDNFFELGGDSILSIQIIARARKAGLQLAPKDIFENQTIARLAAVAASAGTIDKAPALVIEEKFEGDIPLTPIQHWFLSRDDGHWNHYNQAFLFKLTRPLDPAHLETALRRVADQHPALRLRFLKDAQTGAWTQCYGESGAESALLDLVALQNPEQIETVCAEIQANLDVQNGPLMKAVYFNGGGAGNDRLFLCLHHLAVDGVSWRILLEDLEAAVHAMPLGNKTAGFHQWAHALEAFAHTESLAGELPYWNKIADAPSTALPADFDLPAPNTQASAATVRVSLDETETARLLQEVPAAYNTRINDALLTALALAFRQSTRQDSLLVDLEGHGREAFPGSVDVSRTVGWFTTIFPVALSLTSSPHPADSLKAIKEQLRAIPQNGIGFGVLKYLDNVGSEGLAHLPTPEVAFNYLGQFDQVVAGSELFSFAPEESGPWHSHRAERRHLIEIDALVLDGKLELKWSFSQNIHREQSIRHLAENCLGALRELIAHCLTPEAGGRTPSDYPLASLSQNALDELVGSGSQIEDIYPLSPAQLLFYSLKSSPRGQQFDQWHATLRGNLDLTAFQQAWLEVICRHPILRTTFSSDGLPTPVQIVRRNAAPEWIIEDWRSVPVQEQKEKFTVFLEHDRKQGGDLTSATLSRFALLRTADDAHYFLWSVPDLAMDGWSWPLVFAEVSEVYRTLLDGGSSSLEPVGRYRDYIQWLKQQDEEHARAFWSGYLKGFTKPTPLPTSVARESAGASGAFIDLNLTLDETVTAALTEQCRRSRVTLNTALQAAWSLVLTRLTGGAEVLFGAAVSGRPAHLPGVESIVGPFVNNLPVRVSINPRQPVEELLSSLQEQLFTLNHYQHSSLLQVQEWSEMPWRDRLFNSLLVVQNYQVNETALNFAGRIDVLDFNGPVHTNFPVTLLAVPGERIELKLVFQSGRMKSEDAQSLLDAFAGFLNRLPDAFGNSTAALLETSTLKAIPVEALPADPATQAYVAPRSGLERSIADIWQMAFGLDRIGADDNFFDLGGHSLLMVRVHAKLREVLDRDLSIIQMFQFPTVRSLAQFLDPRETEQPANQHQALQDRAARQRAAMSRHRKQPLVKS